MNNFFSELKRRNVVRVAIAYVVISWAVLQFVDIVSPLMGLPDVFQKGILILLVVLFPIALLLSWAYEVTPEGVKKTEDVDKSKSVTHGTGQKINKLIAGALVLAVGFIVYDRFIEDDDTPMQEAQAGQASIAVLPFADLSAAGDQEYFGDGIAEEILNLLAKVPDYKVAGRTSSFQFKGENPDLRDIGDQLGVSYILEGSVRKGSNNELRITAQLIQASDGFHIWSETYDRELTDIFEVQDEIAGAIVTALGERLGISKTLQVSNRAKTDVPEAYEEYLKGRSLVLRRERNAIRQAGVHFQNAVDLDPDYGPAWAGIANVYLLSENSFSSYGTLTLAEVIAGAEPALRRAEELDPEGEDTLAMRASFLSGTGNEQAAAPLLDRVLQINPNNPQVLLWRANVADALGDFEIMLALRKRTVEVDPLFPVALGNYIFSLIQMGRYDEAREIIAKLETFSRRFYYSTAGTLEEAKGNIEGRLDNSYAYLSELPIPQSIGRLAESLAFAGAFAEAEALAPGRFITENADLEQERQKALETKKAMTFGKEKPLTIFLATSPALLAAGEYAEVVDSLDTVERNSSILPTTDFEDLIDNVFAYQGAGMQTKADQYVRAIEDRLAELREFGFDNIWVDWAEAKLEIFKGNLDEGFRLMETGIQAPFLSDLQFSPVLAKVKDDPRYIAILEGERSRRKATLNAFLRKVCAIAAPDENWHPSEETCAELSP